MIAQQLHVEDPVTPSFSFRWLRVGEDRAMFEQIFALRYEIYCLECGFLAPDAFKDGLESDEYDAHAAHFTAQNLIDELVGSVRLVQPAPSQCFPFEQHCRALFDNVPLPPREQCAEVSRLVVRKNYRRRSGDSLAGVSAEFTTGSNAPSLTVGAPAERRSASPQILLGLYREMYRYSLENGIRYWYAAMERSLARALARFEFVFAPIGLEVDYYGPVTPYVADLRELERRVGAANPGLMTWLRGDSPVAAGGCSN